MTQAKGSRPIRRIELKAGRPEPASSSEPVEPEREVKPAREQPNPDAGNTRRVVADGDSARLMLNLEREARKVETQAELRYLIVNATRRVVNYRQAFLLRKKGRKSYRVEAVSSLSAVDRNSNFIRWVGRIVTDSLRQNGDENTALINVEHGERDRSPEAKTYPFDRIVLLPLKTRSGQVFAQLALARETPWDTTDIDTAGILVDAYSHAWEALTGSGRLRKRGRSRSLIASLVGVAVVAAGFIPVPLTVLAPAEVTAADPLVVTAPLDAVIDRIEVEPNTMVKTGDLLFRFNDTDLRNRFDVAGQAVRVAEARYLQAQRNSFADPTAKRELAIALSELKLKAAEYDYAKELLARTEVRAPGDGLIIFADKDDWTGKPVATGERIMRLADPANVELHVDLAVADSIVLERDARVRLFLDSSPLDPVEAKLETASYHARPDKDGVLSYRVVADFEGVETDALRIGLRGTAQIYGDDVPLAFFIFRKPLSVIRQWIGF